MMKLLFIDGWTKGIRNFSRLTPLLNERKVSYKLVHLESWGSDNAQQKQTINGVDCYDISYYKTNYIYNVLKIEKPDVVLILSLGYLLDRTIVSMCNKLGIRIAYLSHGKLYMKQGAGDLSSQSSMIQKIKKRMKGKALMVLKNYIRFNCITRFKPVLVFRALKEFVRHSERSMFTPYTDEFRVDVGMVYYEPETLLFEKRGFPKGMIRAVGNPEIDGIINSPLLERDVFLKKIGLSFDKYVLYMDDGFVQENLLTMKEWLSFINEMYQPLKQKGSKLVIKLHPRTSIENAKEFFDKEGILTIKDADFKNLCYHSEFVFSHSSSTVVYGMIMNKPIVLPRWGKMADLVRNYPDDVVNYVESPKQYISLLDTGIPLKDTRAYLRENCGFLDGKSTKRIVDNICTVGMGEGCYFNPSLASYQ